jgi:hypothetical protein
MIGEWWEREKPVDMGSAGFCIRFGFECLVERRASESLGAIPKVEGCVSRG